MAPLVQSPTMGDVLKYDDNPNYTREVVTLLTGTNYKIGSVLGKITASGKYKLSTDAGADGAQVGAAVLLEPVDASTADAPGVVLVRGPSIVADAQLVYDASVNTAAKILTKNGQLAAAGIVPRANA